MRWVGAGAWCAIAKGMHRRTRESALWKPYTRQAVTKKVIDVVFLGAQSPPSSVKVQLQLRSRLRLRFATRRMMSRTRSVRSVRFNVQATSLAGRGSGCRSPESFRLCDAYFAPPSLVSAWRRLP